MQMKLVSIKLIQQNGGLDDKDDGDEDEFDSPSDADIDRDADKFAKGQ